MHLSSDAGPNLPTMYIVYVVAGILNVFSGGFQGQQKIADFALLDGTNVRLNWNIESDLNVYWIKFKNFLNLY
jgi:hypothetical protein